MITGASSGIGLATTRLAARAGACVVLISRNRRELAREVDALRERGGKAIFVVADVADADALRHAAELAVQIFGGLDTWINNAGTSILGKVTETPLEEARRLFDINFWGMVHGCQAALPHLRLRGGTIVNVGNAATERAVPLQGFYSATKHALRAYTDALRAELESEGAPVNITLVKPAAVDTPFFEHARSHAHGQLRAIPPVYGPEVVARTLLEVAQRPVREVSVGAPPVLLRALRLIRRRAAPLAPAPRSEGNLERPLADEGMERGRYGGHVARESWITGLRLHPAATLVALTGLAALAGWAVDRLRPIGPITRPGRARGPAPRAGAERPPAKAS